MMLASRTALLLLLLAAACAHPRVGLGISKKQEADKKGDEGATRETLPPTPSPRGHEGSKPQKLELAVGAIVSGVLGVACFKEPGATLPAKPLVSDLALVLARQGNWFRVLAGDGAVGWVEKLSDHRLDCALHGAGNTAMTVLDANRRTSRRGEDSVRLLFKTGWVGAGQVRMVCARKEAALPALGISVPPFATSPWLPERVLARLPQNEVREAAYTGCGEAVGVARAARRGDAWIAALYPCASRHGTSYLLGIGRGEELRDVLSLGSRSEAELRSAVMSDLDGDGAPEWVLDLRTGDAEVEARSLVVADGATPSTDWLALSFSDSSIFVAELAHSIDQGSIWIVTSGDSSRGKGPGCRQVKYRDLGFIEQEPSPAVCECAQTAPEAGGELWKCLPGQAR